MVKSNEECVAGNQEARRMFGFYYKRENLNLSSAKSAISGASLEPIFYTLGHHRFQA